MNRADGLSGRFGPLPDPSRCGGAPAGNPGGAGSLDASQNPGYPGGPASGDGSRLRRPPSYMEVYNRVYEETYQSVYDTAYAQLTPRRRRTPPNGRNCRPARRSWIRPSPAGCAKAQLNQGEIEYRAGVRQLESSQRQLEAPERNWIRGGRTTETGLQQWEDGEKAYQEGYESYTQAGRRQRTS